jgi:hypothetical protein
MWVRLAGVVGCVLSMGEEIGAWMLRSVSSVGNPVGGWVVVRRLAGEDTGGTHGAGGVAAIRGACESPPFRLERGRGYSARARAAQ